MGVSRPATAGVPGEGDRPAPARRPVGWVAAGPPVSGGSPSPSEAVAVKIKGAEGFSYAEALRTARRKVSLPEIGITGGQEDPDGGLLVAVRSPQGGYHADALAGRLASLLPEASVARAERSGEVQLVGFDESVLPAELAGALAGCAGCGPEQVRLGAPRWGSHGDGAVWARLPLAAALSAARAGQFGVGWSVVRVEYLGRRPLQCYRCWGYGHVRANCPRTGVDKGRACYRCGREGHIAGGAPRRHPAWCAATPGFRLATGWADPLAGWPAGPRAAGRVAIGAGGGGHPQAGPRAGDPWVPGSGNCAGSRGAANRAPLYGATVFAAPGARGASPGTPLVKV